MNEMTGVTGFIGAADVLMDFLDDNGNPTGFLDPVNCTKFALTAKAAASIDRISRMRDSYDNVLDTVTTSEPHELEATFDGAAKHILAAALYGQVAAYAQTAGAVTDADVTARLGKWVELGALDVSNVVLKDSSGATTYVPGTDYEVQADIGMFRALEGGAITEGQALKADYDKEAVSGNTILAATKSSIDVRFKVSGRNRVNNKRQLCDVWKVRLQSDSVLDLISDKFAEFTLKGKPMLVSGKPSMYQLTDLV